jgi:hypothetical protein
METSSQPPCPACGKPVDLGQKDVLVEMVEKLPSQHTDAIAWHQDCYDQFLEDGEEC